MRETACALVAVLAVFAVPAFARADTVTVRIEGKSGTLVPSGPVQLPSTPVASPVNRTTDPASGTCPGNSIIGAVDAATNHSWAGTWDATTPTNGWSLDAIKNVSTVPVPATPPIQPTSKWVTLVGDVVVNDPPCTATLNDRDALTIVPACLTASTTNCVAGFLEIFAPSIIGQGAPINIHVAQVDLKPPTAPNPFMAQRGPALAAGVFGPNGSTITDSKNSPGDANLTIADKGPAVLSTSKATFASDRTPICVTDGGDGFCGTTQDPFVPFDPLKFCTTTGSDGYCGSPDKVAPLGRITAPAQAFNFPKAKHPTKLAGTVDFDPSQTDHVNLRLMRQITITVKKYCKKHKVWVTKKVHGKRKRVRVTRRKVRKVKQAACYGWNDRNADFQRLKKCDPARATLFPAEGAEVWSYEFLSALPGGSYTLDAQAVDGAGNVDTVPDLGRNRVTFKVS